MTLRPLVEPGPALDAEDERRYARHLALPQLGELGQRRLRNAKVCIIGAGGLGSPALLYLTAAGVGTIGIVDFDEVEASNLHRQVMHGWADVGRPKLHSARDAAHRVDPRTDVRLHELRLTQDNVDEVLGQYDVVLDGTDNFPTRYLVNDACVRLGIPEVWGSIFRFDAQVSVFWGSPPAGSGVEPVDLRDLFPEPPAPGTTPSCAEAGVLGAMCGQVGSVMATEAIKLLTGVGEPLLGRVLVLDVLAARWSEVPLHRTGRGPVRSAAAVGAVPVAAGGPACPTEAGAQARGPLDGAAPGRPHAAVPAAAPPASDVLSPADLAERLARRAAGEDRFHLVDVREPGEHATAAIPGSVLVPVGELLAGRGLERLPPDEPLVLYCHHGARSEQALLSLRRRGHRSVVHLEGGIDAWSVQVDPAVPRY